MSNEVMWWRGERIDTMTREELLDVVKKMGETINELHERNNQNFKMFSDLMEARRGRT